jgi:hypothetical protein
MWIPITLDEYLKLHLKKNPNENEKVLRVGCFSCITGRDYPRGDYEIDGALDKRDKYGRMNINEMDPRKINGMFDDEGYEINPDSIKKPSLCLTCFKNVDPDWEEELLCNLNRNDQADEKVFKCYAFEKL